jgi:3-deoxy-D-manno-octulosonic-acid transferase
MSFLLNLTYLLGALIASPWIAYRLARTRGWGSVPQRFGLGLGPRLEGAIWLHGSSVGETALLRPLVALLETHHPDVPLVISAYTGTGLETARKTFPRHTVVAFPFDLSFVASRALQHFKPRLIVIVESDFWPNFLKAAENDGVPVAAVNAKISDKSFRMHRRVGVLPRLIRNLALAAAQSDEHADRLIALGVPASRVSVTGNMKYDLADARISAGARAAIRASLGFEPGDVVIIGGSLHEPEDRSLLECLRALEGGHAALVLVPRYPSSAEDVRRRALALGHHAVLKTAVDRGEVPAPGRSGVLVVDTLGQLRDLYGAADAAFVGGSLFFRGRNKGGHNLMEPAVLGVAVLFGPYNFSFKETVRDLLAAEAAILVRDEAELGRALARVVSSPAERNELGRRARDVVLNGRGATRRNYALISELLSGGRVLLQRQALNRTMPQAANDADIK